MGEAVSMPVAREGLGPRGRSSLLVHGRSSALFSMSFDCEWLIFQFRFLHLGEERIFFSLQRRPAWPVSLRRRCAHCFITETVDFLHPERKRLTISSFQEFSAVFLSVQIHRAWMCSTRSTGGGVCGSMKSPRSRLTSAQPSFVDTFFNFVQVVKTHS